jgi:hypothetical protein
VDENDLKVPNLDVLDAGQLRAAAEVFNSLRWYCLMQALAAEERSQGNLDTASRAEARAQHFFGLLPPGARW